MCLRVYPVAGPLPCAPAFQFTQHKRRPVLVGEATQLLIEQREQVAPIRDRFGLGRDHFRRPPLFRPPPGFRGPRLEGRAVGYAVQPVADLLPRPDRSRFTDKNEERSLKCVLSVLLVAQDAPADGPDHRPVPADQRFEGGAVALAHESSHEVAVGQAGAVAGEYGLAKLLEDLGLPAGRHGAGLFERSGRRS